MLDSNGDIIHRFRDHINPGFWLTTDLSSQLSVAADPTSNLATVTWDGKAKLFYQASDSTIQELTLGLNGTWRTLKQALPGAQPYKGTNIAAVGFADQNIRVYFQAADNSIWEAAFDGKNWSSSQLNTNGSAMRGKLGTPISATVLVNETGVRLRAVAQMRCMLTHCLSVASHPSLRHQPVR